MDEMMNTAATSLMNAEYYPLVDRTKIVAQSKTKIPLAELATLGTGFSSLLPAFRSATQTINVSGEGLYRCVFPEGVTGALASFKDGSGNLGTIMNGGHIVGQARWVQADSQAATIVTQMPIDPTVLMIAIALSSINQKLDAIQETQKDILEFLQQEKQSKVEGDLNTLTDIVGSYRYNWNNEQYKSSNHNLVLEIRRTAEQNIIFYRNQIVGVLGKKKFLHANQNVNQMLEDMKRNFKYYQMALYTYAYASFLDVMLIANFNSEFLESVSTKIRKYTLQYREDYTAAYDAIESYAGSSIEKYFLGGVASVEKAAGKAIAKIPVISKGPVDEALIHAGKKTKSLSYKKQNQATREFRDLRQSGAEIFIENVDMLEELYNKPQLVLFDKENLYIA